MLNLIERPRRLRASEGLRSLVRETRLSLDQLVQPCFVRLGRNLEQPVGSMPGISQLSPDRLVAQLAVPVEKGLKAVLLFGIPENKDAEGSAGWAEDGPVPVAIRALKRQWPHLVVMADVCLCEYTDHGHCGPLRETPSGVTVDNDSAAELHARAAVCYAQAGADVVAPSGMMDGVVGALRRALDAAGKTDTAIMAYSAKYASHFYGPFREAAESAPKSGDRRGYQMDPANAREAMREIDLDVAEGADIVMVKPALAYLDIISDARRRHPLPIAAYSVSGEYSMLHAAIERGWLAPGAITEALLAIRRAGADIIITYSAAAFAEGKLG